MAQMSTWTPNPTTSNASGARKLNVPLTLVGITFVVRLTTTEIPKSEKTGRLCLRVHSVSAEGHLQHPLSHDNLLVKENVLGLDVLNNHAGFVELRQGLEQAVGDSSRLIRIETP